mgnify:FL=1
MAEEKKTEAAPQEVEAATTKEAPKTPETSPEDFLANFNWHHYEEGIDVVEDKQLEEFES